VKLICSRWPLILNSAALFDIAISQTLRNGSISSCRDSSELDAAGLFPESFEYGFERGITVENGCFRKRQDLKILEQNAFFSLDW
jgi:hypothetical protein